MNKYIDLYKIAGIEYDARRQDVIANSRSILDTIGTVQGTIGTVQGTIGTVREKQIIDKSTCPVYTLRDVESLINMLTLWIDDRKVVITMEEMFKCWKSTQK